MRDARFESDAEFFRPRVDGRVGKALCNFSDSERFAAPVIVSSSRPNVTPPGPSERGSTEGEQVTERPTKREAAKHEWGPLVEDLATRRQRSLGMGGEQFVERQRSLGKLTVRERLERLLDPGTWIEYAMLADHMDSGLGDRFLAADGAVTGVGEIDGRLVAVAAYDFSVMAGSMGSVGENKIRRMRHHAVA